jgi:hypothetical protein
MLLLLTNDFSVYLPFILGCFLLGVIVSLWFMSSNASFNNVFMTTTSTYNYNPSQKIAPILLAQLLHNNDAERALNYKSFPVNSEGYLDAQARTRLVSIIRASPLAHKFRFGSSVETFYIKGTNSYPIVTDEMIGVVLGAET